MLNSGVQEDVHVSQIRPYRGQQHLRMNLHQCSIAVLTRYEVEDNREERHGRRRERREKRITRDEKE